MQKLFVLLFTLSFSQMYAQVNGVVKDSHTKTAIPFVNIWILNQNTGTTADADGRFTLEKATKNDTLVFSCVGYERKALKANTNDFILQPTVIGLKEVVVTPRKNMKDFKINRIEKKSRFSYGNSGYPYIMGRYIPYFDKYNATPFLKKIVLMTSRQKMDATFHLTFYDTKPDGSPNKPIQNSVILSKAVKGTKQTEIDLSDFNLRFPKEGVIVAVEWLVIESNKGEQKYKEANSEEWKTHTYYAPSFYTSSLKSGEYGWRYARGGWKREDELKKPTTKFGDKALGFELVLSN